MLVGLLRPAVHRASRRAKPPPVAAPSSIPSAAGPAGWPHAARSDQPRRCCLRARLDCHSDAGNREPRSLRSARLPATVPRRLPTWEQGHRPHRSRPPSYGRGTMPAPSESYGPARLVLVARRGRSLRSARTWVRAQAAADACPVGCRPIDQVEAPGDTRAGVGFEEFLARRFAKLRG